MDSTATDDEIVDRAYARISTVGTALVLGVLCGAGLFIATVWLVVKGGPHPGPHLGLLSQYFPGYSVTLGGAVLGFFYAFLVGGAAGFVLGGLYNRLVR